MTAGRILIVGDDADMSSRVAATLSGEGFRAHCLPGGGGVPAAIADAGPDLVLLDVGAGGPAGTEACRRLRATPATAYLPVILLSELGRPADKVAGLRAGADDYVVKPFDMTELVARILGLLRRNAEIRAVSPLTGLPGNARIGAEIAARVAGGQACAVCYFDLDRFKAFNDAYGFLRGDEVIRLLAAAIGLAATETGPPDPFLGHLGGDDFVLVCPPDRAEPACRRALEIFDKRVAELYDPADAARGSVELRDRRGLLRRYPLLSVSVGVAMSAQRRFTDHREMVAVATEMKNVAKARRGSAVAVDRRVDVAH